MLCLFRLLVQPQISGVLASVGRACDITASDINFGTVNPLSVNPTSKTGTITATCTAETGWTVKLSKGNGASYNDRAMGDGTPGELLKYNLYTTAAHNNIWGDGTAATSDKSGVGTGMAEELTVYAQVPADQTDVPSGVYTDNITATIEY